MSELVLLVVYTLPYVFFYHYIETVSVISITNIILKIPRKI